MKKTIILILILTIIFTPIFTACDKEDAYAFSDGVENFGEEIKIIKPTVKFQTNGGSYIPPIDTFLIEIEPTTTRDNYHFDGWYLDSTFNVPATYPISIEHDTTLYAKWTLLNYETSNEETKKIESTLLETKGFSCNVTPLNLNLSRLAELGYSIKVTITYDVYYKKTYDVLWDIGYMGAPKFETYLKKSNTKVISKENIEATKTAKTYVITYITSASDLMDDSLNLEFWSDNIQNAVYVSNIKVSYQSYK